VAVLESLLLLLLLLVVVVVVVVVAAAAVVVVFYVTTTTISFLYLYDNFYLSYLTVIILIPISYSGFFTA
jgi:hypothetical protein